MEIIKCISYFPVPLSLIFKYSFRKKVTFYHQPVLIYLLVFISFVLNSTNYDLMNKKEPFDCGWSKCEKLVSVPEFYQSIFYQNIEDKIIYLHIACEKGATCSLEGNININSVFFF